MGLFLSARELQPFHVTRWVAGQTWGETTEYNARRSVFRIFNWFNRAFQEGLLRENPLRGMPRPRSRERCLTDEEYSSLIGASHGVFRIFLWSLRQTGARPCELRRLTWDEVRQDRWIVREHKTQRSTTRPWIVHLTPAMQRLMQFLRRRSAS